MNTLAIITEHLSTGGMPALIALEAANRPDTDIHIFVLCDYRCYVHQNQLESLPNVSIHQYNNVADAAEQIVQDIASLEVPFAVQHDTALATTALWQKGIKTIRFIHSTYGIHNTILSPVPDHFIATTSLVKSAIQKRVNIPVTIVNTAVDEARFNPDLYDRAYCRQRLGLHNDDFVILHLGIWNPNKDQEGMIRIFNQLDIPRKRLLLVGGQYENFKEYWSGLDIPDGAIVTGEVNNPEMYYAAADVFVSTSHIEGCPMSVREACLMQLPCVLSDTIYHHECFDGSCFLFADFEDDGARFVDFIQKQYGYRRDLHIIGKNLRDWTLKKYGVYQYIESLNRIYDEEMLNAKFSKLNGRGDVQCNSAFSISYHSDVRLTFTSTRNATIGFRVLADGEYYERQIEAKAGEKLWIAFPKKQWFIPYHCQISQDGKVIAEETMNIRGQEVLIDFDSRSLGDTLAWLPAVYAFQKKQGCEVVLNTYWDEFLAKVTDFKIARYREDVYKFTYQVGCFSEAKRNWRTISLPEVAMDILGVDAVEPLRFQIEGEPPISDPYLCISEYASTKAKMWNRKGGWQELVDRLTDSFKIAVISLEPTELKGVLDWTGHRDIYERALQLRHAIAYIGCSSGLAWLAEAVGIEVLILNTCTFAWNEPFGTHVERNDVCRGCWNRTEFPLEKSYDWCPSGLDFQCSRYLMTEMVIEKWGR